MLRSGQPTNEERRGLSFNDAAIDIRDATSGSGQRFNGYASVFNTRTAIGNPLSWGFYEQVADGAFAKTLQEGDARMLIDHDSYYVVSRVSAGTLYLAEDARGLNTDSALNEDLSYVRDLRVNVQVRNITGMSFGFRVTKDDWEDLEISTNDGNSAIVELRTIREVQLYEVSAVTFPAYEETTAGLRHSLVPALLRRGDDAAIARACRHRPDLAPMLGYDPELARTVIDVKLDGKEFKQIIDDKLEGELLGNDTEIQPTGLQLQPIEEASTDEPGESTRDEDESTNQDEVPEPVESTRNAPSVHEMAKFQLRLRKAQLAGRHLIHN